MLGEYSDRKVVRGEVCEFVRLTSGLSLSYYFFQKSFYIDLWIKKSNGLIIPKTIIKFQPKNPEVFVTIFKQLDERVGHAW